MKLPKSFRMLKSLDKKIEELKEGETRPIYQEKTLDPFKTLIDFLGGFGSATFKFSGSANLGLYNYPSEIQIEKKTEGGLYAEMFDYYSPGHNLFPKWVKGFISPEFTPGFPGLNLEFGGGYKLSTRYNFPRFLRGQVDNNGKLYMEFIGGYYLPDGYFPNRLEGWLKNKGDIYLEFVGKRPLKQGCFPQTLEGHINKSGKVHG